MDETYIKVKGGWKYLYRAVDKEGQTVDFLLRAHRDEAAARRYFEKAIDQNGAPETVTVDKSGANLAALKAINADALYGIICTGFIMLCFYTTRANFAILPHPNKAQLDCHACTPPGCS
jgi:transposase-like protein